MSKVQQLLDALRDGPKTGAQLAEVIDDITPYVSRTMAKLRDRGLAHNLRAGMGGRALYALVERQP